MNNPLPVGLLLFLVLGMVKATRDHCMDEGAVFKNNSRWEKNACTTCFCSNGIITCDQIQCKDPGCDTSQGESMVIPPNGCCPICTNSSKRHCERNGNIIAHNARWETGNCTVYECDNGAILSSRKKAARKHCGVGQVLRVVSGCPKCVSIGGTDTCTFEGRTYNDDATWSPSQCERISCIKGEIVHHVAQCDNLICRNGEKAVTLDGRCCPSCVGKSCTYEGHEYSSGEQFQIDQCRNCICEAGEVKCENHQCNITQHQLDVSCATGERSERREGSCCSECVSTRESCQHNGRRYFHGDLWKTSKCEVAMCSHGNVRSSIMQCSPVECKWNEKLMHQSCCPECVPVTSSCHHAGYEYRHGDVWKSGLCKTCECSFGSVQCFTSACPACPSRTVAVKVPGECCPDCRPVSCHADCLTCTAPGYGHCVSCPANRLLQEGKCVRRCMNGFYQDGKVCRACHQSCSSCTLGNSPSTCTSCKTGMLLQEGRCVAECVVGFFQDADHCFACPKGCKSCSNSTHCLTCTDRTRLPQGGACVRQCSRGYFYDRGVCKACHPTCSSCSGSRHECLSCPRGKLLENGLCAAQCSSGHFQISISRCANCHATCATCSGSSEQQCLTCAEDMYLYNGRCIDHCPPKHHSINGQCRACHSDCQSCTGSSSNDCTRCTASSYVVQPSNSHSNEQHGTCRSSCNSGHYINGSLCEACPDACSECSSLNSCSRCKENYSLSFGTITPTSKQCLPKSHCINNGLAVDSETTFCYNSTALSYCSSKEKNLLISNWSCVSGCPPGTYSKNISSATICAPCDEGCTSCRATGQCMTCAHGRYTSQITGKCLKTCEFGYYQSKGNCLRCPRSCGSCILTTSSAQPQCTSCLNADAVLQHGQCRNYCVQQFYPDYKDGNMGTAVCRECDWGCTACSGPSPYDCLECMETQKLQNGTCVSSCSQGYYESSSRCTPCSDKLCNLCSRMNQCSRCRSNYFLHDNQCVPSCPRGYFSDSSSQTCVSCPEHCIECILNTNCTQCNDRTYRAANTDPLNENLDDEQHTGRRSRTNRRTNVCVRQCGRGYTGNKHTRVCEVNRHAPVITVTGPLLIRLGSRGLVDVLKVHDQDKESSNLFINLIMEPANGWFELNRTKLPVSSSVSYQQISHGGLWFVHDPTKSRHGFATFQATDGNLRSKVATLNIIAVPQNKPIVTKNEQLMLRIGESAKISVRTCFNISYNGNMDDIHLSLPYPPRHGKLVKLPNYETPIKTFKVSDLRSDVLLYVTTDNMTSSNTTLYDSIIFQITDGYHVINDIINVNLLPKGNNSTYLITNKGTHVERGGMTRITNQHLLTIAPTIKDKSHIVYVIRPKKGERKGKLVIMVPEMSDAPIQYEINRNEWTRTRQGQYQSPSVARFTQSDVDNGYVWYRDQSEESDDDEAESIDFTIYDDSSSTSRALGSKTLVLSRFRENTDAPHLSPALTLPLQVSANEGKQTVLHNGILRYSDQDTPDRDIMYNITSPMPPAYGQIENDDYPHVPITVFTQSDIDSNKIIYRPPMGGLTSIRYQMARLRNNYSPRYSAHSSAASSRPNQQALVFQFTVSDGQHVLPPTNFTINLLSSTSVSPTWGNPVSLLRVSQGSTAILGTLQLSANDPDTAVDELIFTLVKAPWQGTVVRNNVALRVGDTFTNDDIIRGSLMYVHGGRRHNPTDQIQVSVSDGIHSIVAVVQVDIAETDISLAPSPDPRSELEITVEASSEVTLTRENLAYTDIDSEDHQIVYHVEVESLYGILKNGKAPLSPGSTFTQQDINMFRIKYVSITDIGSLRMDDSVHFHVTDSSGNTLPNQRLKITITPARRQHEPVVAIGEPIVVGNGNEVRITSENVIVSDPDTPSHELVVKVLRKPTHGSIINKRTEETMRSQQQEDVWFYLSDLIDGFIYYAHTHNLAGTQDHFTFHVKDNQHTTPTYTMKIYIELANARPILQTSPLVCQNGHAILIKSNSLAVMDSDTPNRNLVFTISSPLNFGKLVKFRERLPHDMLNGWKIGMMNGKMKMKQTTNLDVGHSFTYQDILDQLICYENSVAEPEPTSGRSSRRRRETVALVVSDGTSHQNVEMFIDIPPKDGLHIQSAPPLTYLPENPVQEEHGREELRGSDYEILETEELEESDAMETEEMRKSDLVLKANTGMTVERGSVTTITSQHLKVMGSDRTISYIITRDPNVGKLQYARFNNVADLSADGDDQFTQEEIDEGSIRYNHPASEGGGDVFFKFDIIGGDVDQRFDIHVNEDRQPPRILVNRGLTVQEGGSQRITTQQLSASDESTWLMYEISRPVKLGRIEHVNRTGVSITRFTQADLVAENIRYSHSSELKRTEDQFTFSLTDGTNSIVQVFSIHVELVDNSLPVLENHGIRVQEGVRKTITEFELKATDRDTSNDLIRFTIVTSPQHGTIDRATNGNRYVPVTSFTMDDVYESKISYNHDGTNSLTDTLSFKVSDGTNEEFIISSEQNPVTTTEPQLFHINVVPVDDGTPRLITNLGLNHLEYVDEKALNLITKHILLTEDPDTEPNRIIYTLTSDPRHGYLESTNRGGRPIKSFSQADINANLIRYVLSNSSTEVTSDSFMFNIRDSLPNVVTGNTFNIRWSVISFDKANYTVNEEAGTVDITVTRRGNLNQYAIVLCRTDHGSATSQSNGRSSNSNGQLDYVEHARQVQFDAYEKEKICSITINDDTIYEGTEFFNVGLAMPTDTLLGNVTRATVYINDEKDAPTLQFVETQYTVEERDTVVSIPIKRTGDVEKPVTVVCYTNAKSATGSGQGRIQSGSDYKTRGRYSEESIVTFAPGVSQANCDVKIIDDSLYEDSEELVVKITSPSEKAKIGNFAEATITITGPNDSPIISLTNNHFVFPETAGTVDISVHRSGSDLSRGTDVWCSTKQADPVSATAGQDFIATSTKITFRSEETTKICSLTILDDSQTPTVEGNETFIVYLNSVQKAKLGPPHEAVVVINDTLDDVPKFQFLESRAEVKENSGVVKLPIQRFGDVSSRASVICYTRQNTALAEEDFEERPRSEVSRITFQKGQRVSFCNVTLVDDGGYEDRESFFVRLGDASGDEWYGARVGENDRVKVIITNDEDAPTLQFELSEYSIREPDSADATRTLTVKVARSGDPSEVSKVRCSTRDGSAKSGSDYEPKSRLLRFEPGETAVTFEVNILSNEDTKWYETFLIVLGPQEPFNAALGGKFETTVTILGKNADGSLVLPDIPVVVSLLHYDDVEVGEETDPSPGYPIVCVTPCDPKYPNYVKTRNLCEQAAINASAIRFSWEVAMPTDEQGGVPPFVTVTDSTPFTSVNKKVLDSIYFGRRFHVRCVAQAVDVVTHTGGIKLRSKVITIGTDTGLCHNPVVSGSNRNFQAQSFIAHLNYMPATGEHPNTLHISVKIPHQDGRLPLISTMPINNLNLLLSQSVDRQQHVCSNLMYSEKNNKTSTITGDLGTGLGFIEKTDYSKLSLGPGYDRPYQFDPTVREPETIDLYKYLNLKSCIWQFDAYYHMNELIDFCNGKVERDFHIRDVAESQVTVTVPLHVSYVFVEAPRGWGAIDHRTGMEVSFRYNNVLWRTGIQTDGVLSGRIQYERIKIREDGKLVIKFRTQAKFRGLFVQKHRTLPTRKSQVTAPEGMDIDFNLELLWSQQTYDSPFQQWQAVSTYSRKDYSGEYTVELIPCVVSPTQKWGPTSGKTIPCTASAPEKFKIPPIMFQQTNRPVPVVYRLETMFQLCNNEKVFMMDPKNFDQEMSDYDYKGSFTKGQTIFGRVLWTPEQDLKSAYRLQLDKVYLCTGRDGFVPYFDPTGEVYQQGPQHGCIKPSKNLQHRFLLLDRSNRDAEDRNFHDVPFGAYFASDKPEFTEMTQLSGVDGFFLKVDALYKVEAGHQWYIQVLYVIGSDSALPRVRRSTMIDLSSHKTLSRRRRSDDSGRENPGKSDVGWRNSEKSQNGTNMRGIAIDEPDLVGPSPTVIGAVCASVGLLLLLAVVVCCCLFGGRRKRKRKESELRMIELKTVAIEKGNESEDDDGWSSDKTNIRAKIVKIDKNHMRMNNRADVNSAQTLLSPKQRSSIDRPNNTRESEKPLLKFHSKKRSVDLISNNLHDGGHESGTEV